MTYRMPAEWAQHERVWIGFPWNGSEWPVGLAAAQEQVAAFANAVHDGGEGETVYLITGSEEAAARAKSLTETGIHVQQRKIGDCWLRDTGCITVFQDGNRFARNFGFNGWGGRYLMPGDQSIGTELAEDAALPVLDTHWILEGGAIDVDGSGLAVTTEECLLNPNRNPGLSREDIEAKLLHELGIERLLWLSKGLLGDHTDGHVDNLARFVAPGHLVLPEPSGSDDPNAEIYADAKSRAEAFGLQTTVLPSVGRYLLDGEVAPASYMNFYTGNTAVVVPTYDMKNDDKAVAKLQELFPDKRVIGLPSGGLLRGGGSFHCCSQQVPE